MAAARPYLTGYWIPASPGMTAVVDETVVKAPSPPTSQLYAYQSLSRTSTPGVPISASANLAGSVPPLP